MVHTFELSKMISKDTFDTIVTSLSMRNYGSCWLTTNYADKGFAVIRLYKFKRKGIKDKKQEDSDLTHHYMIALSINTSDMFGGNGDPHLSETILSFTPDYVKAIYFHIFELIPCLEKMDGNYDRDSYEWFEQNVFKARRIDFAFDLKYMSQQYLTLINRGYSLCDRYFKRNYFEDEDMQKEIVDDEPDIPDSEEILKVITDEETSPTDGEDMPDSGYNSDVKYIYFKGKGVNINIYHKQTEIQKERLSSDPNMDYDFLRIEVQVKKNKLNYLVSKHGLIGRELHYLISPEIEEDVLISYVKALTGTGTYVTYDQAMKTIDESSYTKAKKKCLKNVIEAVAKKHGIAKVLEQVENGTITDLGKLPTVKQYLRDIQDMGINPVTISARMGVPKQTLKNQSGGKDLSERVLPNLVDILSAYGDEIKDYQQHGKPITDEEIEQIMKL